MCVFIYVLIRCCLVAKSCPALFVTSEIVARPASLFVPFPRQEYWSGLPFLSPGDLPEPGIETTFPASAGRFFTSESPGQAYICIYVCECVCVCIHTYPTFLFIWWWTLGFFLYLGCGEQCHGENESTAAFSFYLLFLVALGLHCCVQAFSSWLREVN